MCVPSLEKRPEFYYLRPKLEVPPPNPPKVGGGGYIVVCVYGGSPGLKGLRLGGLSVNKKHVDVFPWENRQEEANDRCISLCETCLVISISKCGNTE